MQKQSVGEGWAKDRSEVSIANGVVPGQCRVKRNVLFAVVADGIDVVATCAEKAVHQPMVVLDASAVVGMIWIRMRTTRVVTRERVSRVAHACAVHERQACLAAVRSGQPSEKMIETSILHGHHDDVFNTGILRAR